MQAMSASRLRTIISFTADNMDKIVECFANRSEIEHFSHLATYDEVSENDYNLSVSTYVEAEDTR